MQFSSGVFLMLFLPITLALYKILGRLLGHRVKNLILLAASLFFYAWGEPIFIFVFIIGIMINYFLGLKIDKYSGAVGKKKIGRAHV